LNNQIFFIVKKHNNLYMNPANEMGSCCSLPEPGGRCTVEAIVSVDERGQMVLPKDLRMRARISPGDKLAAISWEKDGKVCCIMLVQVDQLAESVKGLLGPMMKDVL
jgi:AbrB family looped-hinge helix DNA binding protein